MGGLSKHSSKFHVTEQYQFHFRLCGFPLTLTLTEPSTAIDTSAINRYKVTMSRRPLRFIIILALLGITAVSCSMPALPFTAKEPAQTATPISTPTQTPQPTPTVTPTPQPAERVVLADQAIFVGDYERAIQENQTALEAAGDSDTQAAALYGIGRARYLAGEQQTAVQALSTVTENYPDSELLPDAYFILGECYYDLENYDQAAQAYGKYLELRPGVIDAYVQELRGDALMAANDPEQAVQAYAAAAQASQLTDPNFTVIKMGKAYAAMGDFDNAIRKFMGVYDDTDNDYLKAQTDFLAGQVYLLNMDMPEQAYARFQDAVNNYPKAYDSYSSLVALLDEGELVNDLSRGLVDYYAGQYGVAIDAFNRYIQSDLDHDGTPLHYIALSQREMGSPSAAVDTWSELIAQYPEDRFWAGAWDEKAYTQWAYLDAYPQAAQTLLEFVSLSPAAPEAPQALYDAARIFERNNSLSKAVETWQRLIDEYPSVEISQRGLFLAGVTDYRMGKLDQAEITFQRSLVLSVTPEDSAAAYLWVGKIAEAQHDSEAAQTAWQQAAQQDPTGYYSERAKELLAGEAPFTPLTSYNLNYDIERERHLAELWMHNTFEITKDTDLSKMGELGNDERILRGDEFCQLGLYSLASTEYENVRSAVENDPAATFRLLNHLVDLGFYRPAIFASRQILNLANLDNSATFTAPSYFNHVRFGIYFKDLILPDAEAENLNPLFLYSVIRQESLFEAHAQSSAGARGLMQIIPATGQEVASELGWPKDYTTPDLYRPIVSVRLGSHYLARQRNYFDGDLYATLAGYNGGPGNALAWLELANDDPDLFLEVVRAAETRTYILNIAEFMHIYGRLYGQEQ